jgi:hypothetical protein
VFRALLACHQGESLWVLYKKLHNLTWSVAHVTSSVTIHHQQQSYTGGLHVTLPAFVSFVRNGEARVEEMVIREMTFPREM